MRRLRWEPANFPHLVRDWDFVRPSALYRCHRAWDPYVFRRDRRNAALAAADAQRALFFTGEKCYSEVLPEGVSFLTELAASPKNRIVGDYQTDHQTEYPDNRYIRRAVGFALAGQLAKIEAFKEQSMIHNIPCQLQTRHFYEVSLNQAINPPTRRWVAKTVDGESAFPDASNVLVAPLEPSLIRQIERDFGVAVGQHQPPPASSLISRSKTRPATYDQFVEETALPELEHHPAEVLLFVLILGFTSAEALHCFSSECAARGYHAAFAALASTPEAFDPALESRNGVHCFSCLPELLELVHQHERWLREIAASCDMAKGIRVLLDSAVKIGVRPQPMSIIYETKLLALCFDNAATNGFFGDLFPNKGATLRPLPRSREYDAT